MPLIFVSVDDKEIIQKNNNAIQSTFLFYLWNTNFIQPGMTREHIIPQLKSTSATHKIKVINYIDSNYPAVIYQVHL